MEGLAGSVEACRWCVQDEAAYVSQVRELGLLTSRGDRGGKCRGGRGGSL